MLRPLCAASDQLSALADSALEGGTLVAMSAVRGLPEGGTFASEDDRPLHVFHPAGGWHHALPELASGFCVYNDAAFAIAHVLRATEQAICVADDCEKDEVRNNGRNSI
jgi:acetoin utilization deacetylase AcuC-like enzyme